MGLRDYLRRRRERESALSPEQLAAVYSTADEASPQSSAGTVVEGLDRRKLQELQSDVLRIMKEHGIDPMRPDPTRFTNPEVQRELREAALRQGLGDGG